MTYFQLPNGYCPITGLRIYAKSAGTESEKKQKREAYKKKKAARSVVVAMYDQELKATICSR